MLDKGHLAVNLCEFRLAVGAQVFVAEASHNLVVAVHSGHHEQLLEGLWRLRKRIKLVLVQARGHHKVASAFGRRLNQKRSFYVDKPKVIEVAAHRPVDPMAQQEVLTNGSPSDVEVAVLHAQLLAPVGFVFDGEGRGGRGIEQDQLMHLYLNVAGSHVGILVLALHHGSAGLNHEFAVELSSLSEALGVKQLIKAQLRNSISVAQIDEGHAP